MLTSVSGLPDTNPAAGPAWILSRQPEIRRVIKIRSTLIIEKSIFSVPCINLKNGLLRFLKFKLKV